MTLAIIDATEGGAGDAADGISESRYTMPLANIPLISHVLAGVAASGVNRARIVSAAGEGRTLQAALASSRTNALPLAVLDAGEVPARRALLTEIDAALSSGPVLLAPGDGLFGELLADMQTRFAAGDVDLVLSAGDPSAGDPGAGPGGPARLSETAVLLGPRTRPLVTRMLAPGSDDAGLTDVLLGADLRFVVCDASTGWAYDSSTAALLSGNRRVLDGVAGAPLDEELAESNQVHGRVTVGRNVFASGCVIHGPVAIADDVVLEDSYLGPFTAIGRSAVLSGAELDDTIVLAGAVIRHPGHRITASIIGEGVRIERSFELPRSVKLRLGAGSRVHFS